MLLGTYFLIIKEVWFLGLKSFLYLSMKELELEDNDYCGFWDPIPSYLGIWTLQFGGLGS